MRCRAVEGRLSEYLDGNLSARARTRLESHLETCGACRRQCQELRQTVRLVAEHGPLRCPADCRSAVLARLGTVEPARTRLWLPRPALWLGTGLAATAAACVLAVGIYHRPGPVPEIRPTQAALPARTGVDLRQWHEVNRAQQALGAADSLALEVPETPANRSPEPR
jgi:anti-sigma factor RsiW